jgi:hypothetical protein
MFWFYMKKLVTSMASHSTQVGTPKTNYIPMGATHTNKMTIRRTNLQWQFKVE